MRALILIATMLVTGSAFAGETPAWPAPPPMPDGRFFVYSVEGTVTGPNPTEYIDLFSRSMNGPEMNETLVSLRCNDFKMEVRVGLSNNHNIQPRVQQMADKAACYRRLSELAIFSKVQMLVIKETKKMDPREPLQTVKVFIEGEKR